MMRASSFWVIISILTIALFIIGCAGKDGKIGPAGPQGAQGPSGNPFLHTYAGDDVTNCNGCHQDKIDGWQQTKHSHATTNLVAASAANASIPACLKCHTTGYDSIDHYGYDDAMANHDTLRMTALSNVQCEACHGPLYQRDPRNTNLSVFHQAQNATLDDHLLNNGTSPSLCNKCHGQQIQTEWSHSLHGMMFDSAVFDGYNRNHLPWTDSTLSLEWVRSAAPASWNNLTVPGQPANCWECHVAEGFVHANDPTDALTQVSPSRAHMIGCATCHDPHGTPDFSMRNPAGNMYQLRNTADFAVLYYNPNANMTPPNTTNYGLRPKGTNVQYGASMICAQCHHDRPDTNSVRTFIQNGSTSSFWGPHHSPQFDEFVGGGCYEIDSLTLHKVDSVLNATIGTGTYVKYMTTTNRTTSHQTQADADGRKGCVMCHMPDVVDVTVSQHSHASHTFKAELSTCATTACHGSQTTFAAVIASKGSHVTGLEDSVTVLRGLLPADTTTWGASSVSMKTRKAAYVIKYFEEDRSHGAHNPVYARALLTNAIAYLRVTTIP